MIFRQANQADVSGIVALLRRSLGETLMPKSESFWEWKHLNNPFGASPVLLAVEGEEIIGVRAFMNWQWIEKGSVIQSVRAVDTATDSGCMGRGIFTKLTLAQLDYCRERKIAFVFNTPNPISQAGYLKMGWKAMGKLPIKLGVFLPELHRKLGVVSVGLDAALTDDRLAKLLAQRNGSDGMHTCYSTAYLKWRYLSIPGIQYACFHDFEKEGSFLVIYRLKEGRYGIEFRIVEVFHGKEYDKELMKRKFFGLLSLYRTRLATWAGHDQLPFQGWAFKVGPMCTWRSVSEEQNPSPPGFDRWQPSLGTLEVF